MNRLFLLIIASLVFNACNNTVSKTESTIKKETTRVVTQNTPYNSTNNNFNGKLPKNIIFMVGDGMGLTQITAGTYASNNTSNLERFKVIGFHKCYSADDLITDSAAGATAFACGEKTYNTAIAVATDSTHLETILETAEKKGLATGLIATSTITHATPACFIAHQPYRKMYEEIAADFLNTEVDLFIGGGKEEFTNRKDKRNLINELTNRNYYISDYEKESIENLTVPPNKNFGYFTAESSPVKKSEGRDYLPAASEFATNFLKNKSEKGFFLMIEGSQIDWGGHANDAQYIIDEFKDFDSAIGKVLNFAAEDGETLVVITADHETGGFAINGGTMENMEYAFTTGHHSGTMIPVFAYGPGAEIFGGIYENTDIYFKMMSNLNLKKQSN